MNPAQATRLEKEKHPERFCGNSRCLWRRKHLDQTGDYPCPKHGVTIDLMEALKKSLKASQIVIGSKVRRIDEPQVVLRVREIDPEGLIDGTPKALCTNAYAHGRWMAIKDLEVVATASPALTGLTAVTADRQDEPRRLVKDNEGSIGNER